MPEIDSRAAEAAIMSGVPVGSGFAANNRLRLRDSEQVQRLALGQQLLQPYLNRQSQASLQASQLAAEAARQQAADQAAFARLTASEGGATTRAQLGESSALQRALLSEGGATARQRAELEAQARNLGLTLQQRREEAYLPFAQQQYMARLARIGRTPSNPAWQVISAPAPSFGSPGRPRETEFSDAATQRAYEMYRRPTTTTASGITPPKSDPWSNWLAKWGTPPAQFNWTETTSPGMQAAQDYYEQAGAPGEFAWTAPTSPEVAAMQDYYS